MAYTFRPSATRTWVIGKPDPQPRSMTEARRGSVRAQLRTAFTPIPAERALPRPARNSTATLSYPFDRSSMHSPYQSRSVSNTDLRSRM